MVGINSYTVLFNLDNSGHEVVLLFILESDNGSFVDIVMVEMTVDGEYLTV